MPSCLLLIPTASKARAGLSNSLWKVQGLIPEKAARMIRNFQSKIPAAILGKRVVDSCVLLIALNNSGVFRLTGNPRPSLGLTLNAQLVPDQISHAFSMLGSQILWSFR